MLRPTITAALITLVLAHTSTLAATAGNAERGAELYPRACAACHSLVPGEHRTGPSLASIWGRKAGSADGFRRYSPVLGASKVVWDARTLDAWLKNPAELIAGNWMSFPGHRRGASARRSEDLAAGATGQGRPLLRGYLPGDDTHWSGTADLGV